MTLTPPWQRRPALASAPDAPPSTTADVVVVGAGLTGLTTAVLLARAGRSVLVLEGRFVGGGTTGRSTAKVSVLQGTRLQQVARRQPREAVACYVDANLEGQAWLADFGAAHGVELQRRRAITFAHGEHGVTLARRELAEARHAGLEACWEDELDLPFPTLGGVVLDDQLQVDPQQLLDALADQARAHGARVVEGVRVHGVSGRDPVTVHSEAGDVVTGQVVVATGMPVLVRGGFFARMEAQRSYGVAYRTPRPLVDGMYLAADTPSRSLRDAPYDGGDLLLVGGAGHATGRVASPLRHLDELRAWTREHYPEAGEETHAWSAQDYVPAHGLPYAGPVLPGADHLLVAGGYAKWGLTNAVSASLLLAARVLGDEAPAWADVYRTHPAVEARGLTHLARANATVGLEMTTGWLRPVVGALPGRGSGAGGAGGVRFDRPGLPTASTASTASTGAGEGGRAVSGVCTHLGGVVRFNDAERSWDCPLHGSRFDADGEVLEGPATCGLRRRTTD